MHAMAQQSPAQALIYTEFPLPECDANDILLKVLCYGVCRTDLHIVDGELSVAALTLISGHQVLGIVAGKGRSG